MICKIEDSKFTVVQLYARQLSMILMKAELRAAELRNTAVITRDGAWEDGNRCGGAELRQRFQ